MELWYVLKISRLLFLLLLLSSIVSPTFLLGVEDVSAFNANEAGALIDSLDTDILVGGGTSDYEVVYSEYFGVNTAGNYLVATVHSGTSNADGHMYMWEIDSDDGTIIGQVDYLYIPYPVHPNYARLIRSTDQASFYLLFFGAGSGANPAAMTLQISSEGGFNTLKTHYVEASGSYDYMFFAEGMVNDAILLHRQYSYYHYFDTITIHSDGSWSLIDTWALPIWARTSMEGGFKRVDFHGGNYAHYVFGCASGAPAQPGSYTVISVGSDGYIWDNWGLHSGVIGGGTLNCVYKSIDQAKTCYIDGGWYCSMGYISGGTGHDMDTDLGFELTHFDTITMVGTPEVEMTKGGCGAVILDASKVYRGQICSLYSFNEGSAISMLYNYYDAGDNALYMRTFAFAGDGTVDQDMVSLESEIYNPDEGFLYGINDYVSEGNGMSGCKLGDSDMSFFAATVTVGSISDMHLLTIEHYAPPKVETLNVFPDIGYVYGEGEVESIGASNVFEWGFVYNTLGAPVYSDSRVCNTGSRPYPFEFDDYMPLGSEMVSYFVKAYACNSSGTGFGGELQTFSFPNLGPGTDVLHLLFEPEDSSDIVVQDHSPCDNDLFYLWADLDLFCETGGVSVAAEAVEIEDYYKRSPRGAATSKVFDPVEPPDSMYQEAEGENLPLYELFGWTATYLEWGTGMLYMFAMMIAAVGIGVAASVAVGSPLVGALACGFMLSAGMSTGVVPLWLIIAYGFFAVSYLVTARSM